MYLDVTISKSPSGYRVKLSLQVIASNLEIDFLRRLAYLRSTILPKTSVGRDVNLETLIRSPQTFCVSKTFAEAIVAQANLKLRWVVDHLAYVQDQAQKAALAPSAGAPSSATGSTASTAVATPAITPTTAAAIPTSGNDVGATAKG